jgi:mono/diheme cytochrome c family protein
MPPLPRSLPICFAAAWVALSTLATVASAQDDFSERPGELVYLWTREAGSYADREIHPKLGHKSLDLSRQSLKVVRRYDLQYQETLRFRGVPLLAVVEAYAERLTDPDVDQLILHFKNGVAIPVPLEDDRQSLKRIDAFVATAFKPGAAPSGPKARDAEWSQAFPPVGRLDEKWRDPVALRFGANKLVVKDGWHPALLTSTQKQFTPWRHADTLVGIEFVNKAAYEGQFLVDRARDPQNAGAQVFQHRCQFCHSVRQVGATYGWDFVTPVPIVELKQANHLYNKVKYPYHDAIERGLAMPTQTDVTEAEMTSLYRWLEAITEKGPRPYRP